MLGGLDQLGNVRVPADAAQLDLPEGELLISWERFQDEQSQEAQTRTESYVRQAAALLKAEISLLLKSDGTLETID